MLVAVHCSQAPKSTLVLVVSQTGVAPLQAPPLSPHEHLRQLVSVVPEQTARAVPVLVHLLCLLLQSCCTTQVRPVTVMVSPGAAVVADVADLAAAVVVVAPAGGGGVVVGHVEADVRVGDRLGQLVGGHVGRVLEGRGVAAAAGRAGAGELVHQRAVDERRAVAAVGARVVVRAELRRTTYPTPCGPVTVTLGGKSTM